MEVEKLQNHTRKPTKRWEPSVFFFFNYLFPRMVACKSSTSTAQFFRRQHPTTAVSRWSTVRPTRPPLSKTLSGARGRKKLWGSFSSWFLFLSRQRTHPGQHHKRSDRHHKWLNSQWLHLEGKGGEGQGRGCLTGLGCQKRSFEAGKRVEGRVKHILQGLHRLCEPFGTSVPWNTESDAGASGADTQMVVSNEGPMRNSV